MPASAERFRPQPQTAAVRCYNQGLGDCFLLAFPRPAQPDEPYYVVIDCGVAHGTPDEAERMRAVVADIRDATGGRLDALAMTHQHYDHVIGFVHAADIWQDIRVDQLWLPWTEKPGDPDAATIHDRALRLSDAAHQAVARATRQEAVTGHTALGLTGDQLAAGEESFGISTKNGIDQGWQNGLNKCPDDAHRIYSRPGDVISLADTGVQAYVLGPPGFKNRLGEDLLSARGKPLVFLLEDSSEMYSYQDIGLDAASPSAGPAPALYATAEVGDVLGLASALLGPDADADFKRFCPFDATRQIGWDDALTMPFFWEHYTADADWRRVDFDWLESASDLALRAGGYTNNISLVLAFELPQSKQVLLFAADAQVGNWLSWHRIGQWRPLDLEQPGGEADMDDLLGRVAFYKVGHHGSHNATVRRQGLEKMPQGIQAFIPVSVPVAHDIMGYCPMPFYPVLRALQDKTGGAVFLANGKLLEPLPAGADPQRLQSQARAATQMLAPKIRNKGTAAEERLEDAVPLWLEFSFQT